MLKEAKEVSLSEVDDISQLVDVDIATAGDEAGRD
jgi:hypothetical protein